VQQDEILIGTQAGLCARCQHLKVIQSERGSRFVMCLLSRTNPAFPKYPPLPVLSCAGYVESGEGKNKNEEGH
jgi:hypothetical protein